MVVFPNAKINIGLNIVARREDGYHDIETVFYPIDICDIIEITPSPPGFRFECHPAPDGCPDEQNLAVRAYRLLQQEFDLPPLCIELVKLIPTGAGLGGGSSDASSMLKAVNDLCRLGLDDSRMEGLASRLGADCAFFIAGRPVYATGIGDVFTPVGLDLSGYHIVVVKPGVSVPTREAFSQVKPRPSSRRLADDVMLPVSQWRHCITNDFEAGVFALHPEIGQIKDALYASGALYASMSGSGSAVYGIFDSVPDGVADRFAGCFCRVMEM